MTIALLSASLASDDSMLAEVSRIPETVAVTLSLEGEVARVVQRYRFMRECVVIGRGYNYASAYELALKLKELTYTIVEAYSSADFLHGPLALIEHGFPAIVLAPSGAMQEEMRTFIKTISRREGEILAISDDPDTLELAHIPLALPARVPEWISPITTIVPGQIFAMHLAGIRNYDPDQPRGLHKVTKTR
jgi:glucosamine--fructose-6-phosphate aminotransferase (isomerizing)